MEPTPNPTFRLSGGAEMPMLGLGTWQMPTDEATGAIEHALELGYRLIDTSGDYGTEPHVGEALRSGVVERDEVFVVSKVEEHEDAHASARERVETIGIDRLDLCLIHRPPPDGAGEALWRGLIAARHEGLTREIGVSNYTAEQIDELLATTGEVPAVNQVEWSPFGYSQDLLDHAKRNGIAIQAYSPLTRGERLGDETVVEIADAHAATPAQVILRWNLERGTGPIPKAASPEHREENLGALELSLSPEEVDRLDALNERYSSLAGLPYV